MKPPAIFPPWLLWCVLCLVLGTDATAADPLARTTVAEKELRVSGERYRVLVLPAMRAVRWSTLHKAVEFQRGGGLVVVLGAVPEASDRAGRDDAELNALVAQLTTRVEKPADVAALVAKAFAPDFAVLSPQQVAPNFMHRKIGPRDVFLVHNAPQDAACWFRATGQAELWDPWTGQTRPLPVLAQTADGTRLRLPLSQAEAHLIVFSPGHVVRGSPDPAPEPRVVRGSPDPAQGATDRSQASGRPAVAERGEVGRPAPNEVGRPAPSAPQLVGESEIENPKSKIELPADWEFELQPTLDNRFGDYRWPPTQSLIGAEARQFRYADEVQPNPGWETAAFDDSQWPRVTHAFGPKFWKLGPLPADVDLDAPLAELREVDPARPVEVGDKKYRWQPYDFSWRWGAEGDPGHQGYHGLKENVTDEFLCLGARQSGRNEFVYGPEAAGTRYYLWTTVAADRDGPAHALVGGLRPAAVWLNHEHSPRRALALKAGANPLLLRYDKPGRGYFVVSTREQAAPAEDPEYADDNLPFSAAAAWIWYPEEPQTGDRWFRKTFELGTVPSRARLRITCDNGYAVTLNGQSVGHGARWETVQEYDVAGQLRPGRNVLDVRATNAGASAGLIAELSGDGLRVATDATWRCAKREAAAESDWVAAQVVADFPDSLWANHPQGPPRLEAAASGPAAERPASAPAPLAMRWWGDKSILPFDTRPQVARPAGWYRFRAAPGLCAMTVPATSPVQAWVDGHAVRGAPRTTGWRFELPAPVTAAPLVALRIEQPRGDYGGAAIGEPIALECGPGTIAAGDWSKAGALECYSGGAWYRQTVTLRADQIAGGVTLDLGQVVSSAEVRVNGRTAGVRLAPPWRVDITNQVQPGANRIEVLVYNTLANHYLTIPTRYRGDLTAGLLGPVTLETAPAR